MALFPSEKLGGVQVTTISETPYKIGVDSSGNYWNTTSYTLPINPLTQGFDFVLMTTGFKTTSDTVYERTQSIIIPVKNLSEVYFRWVVTGVTSTIRGCITRGKLYSAVTSMVSGYNQYILGIYGIKI